MGRILGEPPEGVWHFGKIWQKFVNKKFTKNFSKWLDFAEIRRITTMVALLNAKRPLWCRGLACEDEREKELLTAQSIFICFGAVGFRILETFFFYGAFVAIYAELPFCGEDSIKAVKLFLKSGHISQSPQQSFYSGTSPKHPLPLPDAWRSNMRESVAQCQHLPNLCGSR